MASFAPTRPISRTVIVIHLVCRPGRGTGMAVFAIQCCATLQLRFGNMIGWFAGGSLPIMTTRTISGDSEGAVIGLGSTPSCVGLMASLTTSSGLNVATGLAGGRCAVVACGAPRYHRHIGVELGGGTTAETLVASATGRCGGNMRGIFAGRRLPVMATGAIGCTGEGAVIRLGSAPRRG